jgi:hypothetical protein
MTILGSDPIQTNWNVTRGDTSIIRLEFLEDDEATPIDISAWDIISTAYNIKTKTTDDLEVTIGTGFVDITVPADISIDWGTGFGSVVGTLFFDVQVTSGDFIWTPVTGTITVLGNVSGVL